MLADGIDKAVSVEHREPFRIWVTIVARFAGAVEYSDRTAGGRVREFFTFPVRGKVEYDVSSIRKLVVWSSLRDGSSL